MEPDELDLEFGVQMHRTIYSAGRELPAMFFARMAAAYRAEFLRLKGLTLEGDPLAYLVSDPLVYSAHDLAIWSQQLSSVLTEDVRATND